MENEPGYDAQTFDPLIIVGKIQSADGAWNPAMKTIKSHDIDPIWMGSLLFLILDKYINTLPENVQVDYMEETLEVFNTLIEEGSPYISQVEDK